MNFKTIITSLSLLALVGCNTIFLPLDYTKIDVKEKALTMSTLYQKNYIEIRLMNVGAVAVGGGAIGAVMQESSVKNNMHTSKDKFENEKLGDFDVFQFFKSCLTNKNNSIQYFKINYVDTGEYNKKIVDRIKTKKTEKLDQSFTSELQKTGVKYVLAMKFQYGIDMRVGSEQMGFNKTYRPYVRIVAAIKNVNTNEITWGNNITIFSENTAYKGRKAIEEASASELQTAYKELCKELAGTLIDDMNGTRFEQEEQMFNTVGSDNDL